MVLRAGLVESCAGRLLENAGLEGRCAWRSKMRLEGGRLPGLVESSTGQVGHAGQERKRHTGLVGRSGEGAAIHAAHDRVVHDRWRFL